MCDMKPLVSERKIVIPEWMQSISVQAVIRVFKQANIPLCFVGGCVRDTLLEASVHDIDAVTPALPDQVLGLVHRAGLKGVHTGKGHGTVTVLSYGQSVEVTTLRRDVDTDGRRAVVEFTREWAEDAKRRDFTINALYLDETGHIFDPVGGARHLVPLQVIFIGDADVRIREDYLRILRFFRFMARFGLQEADPQGVAACARNIEGLSQLSRERITDEVLKILGVQNPMAALTSAHSIGALEQILPKGVALKGLGAVIKIERTFGLEPCPRRRLAALLGKSIGYGRLRLSNTYSRHIARLHQILEGEPVLMHEALYRYGTALCLDWLVLSQSLTQEKLQAVQKWVKPLFPLVGHDLIREGLPQGPLVGRYLKKLEAIWIQSTFSLTQTELLEDFIRLKHADDSTC